MPSRLHVD